MNFKAETIKALNREMKIILEKQKMIKNADAITVETNKNQYLYLHEEELGKDVLENVKQSMIGSYQKRYNTCLILLKELNGNG